MAEPPDLEPSKLNISCDKTPDEASVDTLFQNTINCVRGVAAGAIARLLWEHSDWVEKLEPGLEALAKDPHPVIRMAVIEALLPLINIDLKEVIGFQFPKIGNQILYRVNLMILIQLLERNIHTLFDRGYITVGEDLHIEVSKRIKEDYGNGREYYAFHGKKLVDVPDRVEERPSIQFIRWHNENVFIA